MPDTTASYLALPQQQQNMAPTHQTLITSLGNRHSIPRKPSGSPTCHTRKPALVSEQEMNDTSDNVGSTSRKQWTGPSQRSAKDKSSRIWLVELASLMVAFIAFMAIILTLSMHQDRPLPKWPSLISINTLISIFTNVMQAAMLLPIAEGISQLKWLWFRDTARPLIDLEQFDSASRGPWGCTLLIVRRIFQRHTTGQLAALGAIITVTAMAIDPFAQQVIQYDYCSATASDITAFVPRTNNYTAGQRNNNGGAGLPSSAMNAAFFGEGLYNPPMNASTNIRTNCPTGNCTFPTTSSGVSYMSLGMCSSCIDISDTITNSTKVSTATAGAPAATNLYYRLPSGLTISPVGEDLLVTTEVVIPPESLVQGMVTQSITTFQMLMSDLASSHVSASRCSLTPCVKSYGANITNGVLHEHELSSFPLQILPAPEGTAYFGIFANSTVVVDGQERDCTPTKNPTSRNTLRMEVGTTWVNQAYFQNISSAPYYPPECAFTLGAVSTDGLGSILYDTYNNQSIEDIGTTLEAEPWMLQLYDNGAATPDSVGQAIAGLASTITAAMRNGGDAVNSAPAVGTVMVSQTCVRVLWAWLMLPASLLVLSTLFFVGTILQTSADSLGRAWKSSPLALLFHGFSSYTAEKAGSFDALSEMSTAAREMRVQLRMEQDGWKFSEVPSEDAFGSDRKQADLTADEEVSQAQTQIYFAPPPRFAGKG